VSSPLELKVMPASGVIVQIPQEECLTRVEGGTRFCYMSGAAITSANRSCSGLCRRLSTGVMRKPSTTSRGLGCQAALLVF
jgi:hypothetical protein